MNKIAAGWHAAYAIVLGRRRGAGGVTFDNWRKWQALDSTHGQGGWRSTVKANRPRLAT